MADFAKTTFSCPHCKGEHPHETVTCPVTQQEIAGYYKNVGRILEGKYALSQVIGEGGMGVVYLAKHLLIGRNLAVKILFPDIATHPEIVERFYNEARTAASIGHDHIIEITDMGTFEKSPFIVMEFLEGQSLTQYMKDRVLAVEDAVGILVQVLDALNAVHSKGVIHRDLKPDNIFLICKGGRSDFVKLLDFGISKLKTPEAQNLALTRTGTILGTPYYMAPEQAAGRKDQDHRIDIYAVGVILYEMLSGQLPFLGDNYNALIAAILTEEPARPSAHNPSLPQEIENIIMTAISKQPHLRYPNAVNLMEALRPFAPVWALRPSKVSPLSSTMNYGQTVATPTTTPLPLGGSQVTARTPSAMGITGTSDMAMTAEESRKRGRKTAFIIGGAVLGLLVIVGGGLGIALGTGLLSTNSGGTDPGIDGPKVGAKVKPEPPPVNPPTEPGNELDKPPVPKPTLEILGAPEGATVTLGGVKLSGNPAEIDPSDEARELKIEAEGYEPLMDKMVVNKTMAVRIPPMTKVGEAAKGTKKKKKIEAGDTSKPIFVVEKEATTPTPEVKDKKKDGKKKGTTGYGGKEGGIDTDIYE
jgi:serine/threonine protein kinase